MPASRRQEQRTEREEKCWLLRQKGYTLEEISQQVGVHRSVVCRILGKLNQRALRDNTDLVAEQKVEQTQLLWHTISQAMRAWEASKEPLQRVRQLEDGQTITEVVRREGNVHYLHTVFKAMGDIRSIWGLDIAPQTLEPVAGIAQLMRDMQARGAAYEARKADEADPGDTGGVPPEPGSGVDSVQG